MTVPTKPEASEVDALRAAYLTLHEASGFRVGDKVRVLRKAASLEAGWDNVWDKYMDRAVGDVFTIIKDGAGGGFLMNSHGGLFPWFVLELVERAPERVASITIESQGVTATATPDAVQVGEQTFTREQIAAFAKAMDDAKGGER